MPWEYLEESEISEKFRNRFAIVWERSFKIWSDL